MISSSRWRLLAGVLLILLGLLTLVSLWFEINLAGMAWGIVLGLAGAFFLGVMLSERQAWWAAFPAFPLLGVGVLLILNTVNPRLADLLGGALVLGSVALSFILVYIQHRDFWWALIPAGVMLTLSVESIAGRYLPESGGWVFFAGLGLTFLALYFVPGPSGVRMTWPLYPALGLLLFALVLFIGSSALGQIFWPLVLIALGGFLVYRALRGERASGR